MAVLESPLPQLGEAHLLKAFAVKRALFPEKLAGNIAEAFEARQALTRALRRCLPVISPCNLLQVTGSDSLLFRPSTYALVEYLRSLEPKGFKPAAGSAEGDGARASRANQASTSGGSLQIPGGSRGLLLRGPAGSGKTALLLSAVQWARQRGWVALYVPSGFMLTGLDGWPSGFYSQHEGTGLWDTPDIARRLVEDLVKGNRAALAAIRCKGAGRTGEAWELGHHPGAGR